jgi:hypothetical protein
MLGDFDWGSDDDYQVNANTRVKTTWGEVIEGRVIAYDKARNVVSIRMSCSRISPSFSEILLIFTFSEVPFPDNNGQKQIRIININAIAQQLLGAVPSNTNQLLPLTKDVPPPEKTQKIEQESISKMQNASKKIGVGVPKEAQDIFNAIENMYIFLS